MSKELQLHTAQVKHLRGISMFCFNIVGKKESFIHTHYWSASLIVYVSRTLFSCKEKLVIYRLDYASY